MIISILKNINNRLLIKDIEQSITYEERRANFLIDFLNTHQKENLKFMNEHLDKSYNSINEGINILSDFDHKRKEEFISQLKISLNKVKNGKDAINS